jgi:MYXO-CTERM domain-containing protein
MSCKKFVLGAAMTVLVSLLAVRPAAAAEIVYQNDSFGDVPDGTGAVVCGFAVGEKFAALFVPEEADYPFTIESIRFALFPYRLDVSGCEVTTARVGVPVTVEIWNDSAVAEAADGAPIYTGTEWTIESSESAMIELLVGDESEMLIESGVIRVAVTLQADDVQPIRDDDGITTERNLIYDIGGTWHWSSDYAVTGDWLLRLVVDTTSVPEADDTEPIVEPAPDADEDALEDPAGDVLSDVPADDETDSSTDPQQEEDSRLGGGGCACSLADRSPRSPFTAFLVLFAVIGLLRRSRI